MQNHLEMKLQDLSQTLARFQIALKFSETLVFQGTILYPLKMMRYSYLYFLVQKEALFLYLTTATPSPRMPSWF